MVKKHSELRNRSQPSRTTLKTPLVSFYFSRRQVLPSALTKNGFKEGLGLCRQRQRGSSWPQGGQHDAQTT